MLRNHCGWAWRRFVASLLLFLLFFYSSTARGGPLPPYQAPMTYTISGQVYYQTLQGGVTVTTGVAGATVILDEWAVNSPTTLLAQYTLTTGTAGRYTFGSVAGQVLTPSTTAFYTITDTPPSGQNAVGDAVGSFVSAAGSLLTAPMGINGIPANGKVIDLSNIGSIVLPLTSNPGFAVGTGGATGIVGGKYSAGNYNFQLSVMAPSGSLASSLSLVGTNNRMLVGPTGSLGVTGAVQNVAGAGSSSVNWAILSKSTGLSVNPASGINLGIGTAATLTGTVANLSSAGTQTVTLSISGSNSGNGQPVNTSTSSVTVDALQPRQLAVTYGTITTPIGVPAATGGLLEGAVVPVPPGSFYVTGGTADSYHATKVNVGGGTTTAYGNLNSPPGMMGQPVGQVTTGKTLVDGSSSLTTIPVSIGAIGVLGPVSGSASVSVATAETFGDTTNYASVGVNYSITNVGYAATGGVDPSNANTQRFGAPLSAPIAAGAPLALSTGPSLTSLVGAIGTSGSNSTTTTLNKSSLLKYNTVNAANFAGTVGSQCDIVASTVASSSGNVTMAWRARNNYENHVALGQGAEQLPNGVQWLTSDVVDIEGLPASGLTYAMQMSYDDGINSYIEPSVPTAIDGSYIGKLVGNQWETPAQYTTKGSAVTPAMQGYAGSLTAFLAQYYTGSNLGNLAGSWGVDLNNRESWVIVNSGGGQFAVVPEPSTCALLGAGIAVLLVYRARRNARRKSLAAG